MEHDTFIDSNEAKKVIGDSIVTLLATKHAEVTTKGGADGNQILAQATIPAGEHLQYEKIDSVAVEYSGPTHIFPFEVQTVRVDSGETPRFFMMTRSGVTVTPVDSTHWHLVTVDGESHDADPSELANILSAAVSDVVEENRE